jgi:transposase
MVARIEEKDKYTAIFLRDQGYSVRKIAEKLNRHHSAISNILKRYDETGSVQERHRSGRPPISNARDQRLYIRPN